MNIIGKIIYIIFLPIIYLIIRGSTRAYVAIIYHDKILVTQNFLSLHNNWRLPGGGLKKGETEITGLIREVQEEVGINIIPSQLSLVISNKMHKRNFTYSVFVCQLRKPPVIKKNNKEILKAQFIPIASLQGSDKSSESLRTTIVRLIDD